MFDVGSGLDERQSYVVDIVLGAPSDVGEVFFGQDVAAKVGVGEIKTFFRHDEAVVFYSNLDGGARNNVGDGGLNLAIEHGERFAGLYLFGEIVLNGDSEAAIVCEAWVGFEY